MVDEPRQPQSADDDLDRTIDQLELLLESKRELLKTQPADRHPPPGVAIPKLTEKIVDIDPSEFKGTRIPATPANVKPFEHSAPPGTMANDVEILVNEKMRNAFEQLKTDIIKEIERGVSQSMQPNAST
ncbi:MAG: hypothetical protein O3C28_00770 [Proteobacteria bacterium]|nr:hypothetical protein [Pseudomonadota bacterium]